MVQDRRDAETRAKLADLRAELGRAPSHVLHFLKFSHPDRIRATQVTRALPIHALASVIICKEPLRDSQTTRLTDADPMYLWALRLLVERVSWCIAAAGGSGAAVTFAEVKGFQAEKLHDYRARLENGGSDVKINWALFKDHPFRISRPPTVELLQVADIAASAIYRAVEPDPHGNTEPRYLKELGPKIYRRSSGAITSYGLKTFPSKVSQPGEPLHFLREH
jgi:hypothetical protein